MGELNCTQETSGEWLSQVRHFFVTCAWLVRALLRSLAADLMQWCVRLRTRLILSRMLPRRVLLRARLRVRLIRSLAC